MSDGDILTGSSSDGCNIDDVSIGASVITGDWMCCDVRISDAVCMIVVIMISDDCVGLIAGSFRSDCAVGVTGFLIFSFFFVGSSFFSDAGVGVAGSRWKLGCCIYSSFSSSSDCCSLTSYVAFWFWLPVSYESTF